MGSENRVISERNVLLTLLDEDCLLDGELHPSIHQRLARIRELPMTAVANLCGVERIDGRPWLVWDWIAGSPLEELLPTLNPERRQSLQREILRIVQALHRHGIVHGSLHPRNIVVDDAGIVRLTDLSPLLHGDPEVDLRALRDMFEMSDESSLPAVEESGGLRKRAIAQAALAVLVGLVVAASILWLFTTAS